MMRLKTAVQSGLKKIGYTLINTEQHNLNMNYYRDVLIESSKIVKEENIESIVFSKDRAIQLHAFLLSYTQKVRHYGPMYILYRISDDRHKKSYEDLKKTFSLEPFVFIEEQQFRDQLLDIIKTSKAKTIGFYVDDMVFLRSVNYEDILKITTLDNVVSLSRGKDMDYSIVLQRKIDLPTFTDLGNELLLFNWDQYDYLSDWTYPLGVSGYFYGRDELFVMFNQISFKAPNSLEMSMQKFRGFFKTRNGVCYETISCCCVHANIVQTECVNPILGGFSIEGLLEKWEQGLMIDVSQFYGKLGSEAQFLNYSFVKR